MPVGSFSKKTSFLRATITTRKLQKSKLYKVNGIVKRMKTAKKSHLMYNQPSEGSWDIPEVLYRGERGTYRLFEKMTPAMTQDQLAELYEKEKRKGNPHPTDMPLVWALATRALELRNEEESDQLKLFLKKGFRKFPITLTRIVYNPSEDDVVIHNYGTQDDYSFTTQIIGDDVQIRELTDPAVLEKILGTQDIQNIDKVARYINGSPAYLWFNVKPNKKEESVARFYADEGRLAFVYGRHPLVEYPAFRVLRLPARLAIYL